MSCCVCFINGVFVSNGNDSANNHSQCIISCDFHDMHKAVSLPGVFRRAIIR